MVIASLKIDSFENKRKEDGPPHLRRALFWNFSYKFQPDLKGRTGFINCLNELVSNHKYFFLTIILI